MNHNNSIILNSAKSLLSNWNEKNLFDQEAAWGEFDVSVISGSFTERNKTANKYVIHRILQELKAVAVTQPLLLILPTVSSTQTSHGFDI